MTKTTVPGSRNLVTTLCAFLSSLEQQLVWQLLM